MTPIDHPTTAPARIGHPSPTGPTIDTPTVTTASPPSPASTRRPGSTALLWLALVVTVTAPVVLNAVNLYRLSVDRLGLTGPAALALPVTLDAAALVALIVRLRALRDGDSAPGASLAVLAFAGISAWLAATEGHTVGGAVGALALGVLPIVAVVMLDLAVASIRRADLRAAGLLPGRAPVYSGLRWVLAPASTAKAWRHGVLWEDPDRMACLAATIPPDRVHGTPLGPPPAPPSGAGGTGTRPDGIDGGEDVEVHQLRPEDVADAPGRMPRPLLGRSADPGVGIGLPGRVTDHPPMDHPAGSGGEVAVGSAPSRAATGDTAPPARPGWQGTKRDLIRSLIASGIRDRADIVTACTARGVDVSAREVSRLLTTTTQPRPAPSPEGSLGRRPAVHGPNPTATVSPLRPGARIP
jgi:hypothetical protein